MKTKQKKKTLCREIVVWGMAERAIRADWIGVAGSNKVVCREFHCTELKPAGSRQGKHSAKWFYREIIQKNYTEECKSSVKRIHCKPVSQICQVNIAKSQQVACWLGAYRKVSYLNNSIVSYTFFFCFHFNLMHNLINTMNWIPSTTYIM